MYGSDSESGGMHSDSLVDSGTEFDYQDSDADFKSEGGEDEGRMVTEPPEARKAPYTVMSRTELVERQLRCVTDASELLEVAHEESFLLLRAHGWDLARLQEAWFSDEGRVRERCGLCKVPSGGQQPAIASSAKVMEPSHCPICMQLVDRLDSLDCGHSFCVTCWQTYLHMQVDDGKASVQARCPQHQCGRIVPATLFRQYCDAARKSKYEEWCLRSYVDDNSAVKWCTNPSGCSNACEYLGADLCEIRCHCTFIWCWDCGDEAHRPADCGTVNRWNVKNSAESENISWIMANTKNCPKCRKPIEKNQGCNHMTCARAGGCGHEFCWLCLGDWASHGTSTGGYYQCNIYDKQAKDGQHAEEETTRMRAKHELDKYRFFFERFMDHDHGMKLAVREEQDIEGKVQVLHDKHGFEIIELQFLLDALKQVRACRRVLKWTYVYGYYLEDTGVEKNLFEHLQKNLEEKTDCLHEMLEKDFDGIFFPETEQESFVSNAEAHQKFMEFRSHVTNFTNVTGKFRDRILLDLGYGKRLTLVSGHAMR